MPTLTTLGRLRGTPRRTFRLIEPRQQLRLAIAIMAVTLMFGVLAVANSYVAYGDLLDLALTTAPVLIGEELADQTHHYIRVTAMLLIAYALTVVAVSMIFVRRLVGPVVALERHARALQTGDYASRVGLRPGHSVHAGLARQLNDLAKSLERHDPAVRDNAPLPV